MLPVLQYSSREVAFIYLLISKEKHGLVRVTAPGHTERTRIDSEVTTYNIYRRACYSKRACFITLSV